MHGHGKSDSAIVAKKYANKAGIPAAERMERRVGAEGNAGQQSTCRAQDRVSVSQALERIRQAARTRKKEQFTALLHHINIDLLRVSGPTTNGNQEGYFSPGEIPLTGPDDGASSESSSSKGPNPARQVIKISPYIRMIMGYIDIVLSRGKVTVVPEDVSRLIILGGTRETALFPREFQDRIEETRFAGSLFDFIKRERASQSDIDFGRRFANSFSTAKRTHERIMEAAGQLER